MAEFTVSPNYKGKHPKSPEELAEQRKENNIYKTPNVIAHAKVCKQLNSIYAQKNHDYGDSFKDTYDKLGIVACITRMSDKMNRLISLGSGNQQTVKDESIKDTCLDLANYAIMTFMCLDGYDKA